MQESAQPGVELILMTDRPWDGKTIEKMKLNGPYRLGNLSFTWGSSNNGTDSDIQA